MVSDIVEFSNQAVVCLSNSQVSCNIDGESIILNLKDGLYYGLDPVGARIWGLLQEPKTIQQIQDILLAEYEVEPEVCSYDLRDLLQELVGRGLIEVRNEVVG